MKRSLYLRLVDGNRYARRCVQGRILSSVMSQGIGESGPRKTYGHGPFSGCVWWAFGWLVVTAGSRASSRRISAIRRARLSPCGRDPTPFVGRPPGQGGRDCGVALDVVEVVDDGLVDHMGHDPGTSVPRFLFTVTSVDTPRRRVLLDREPRADAGDDAALHPLLRRSDGGPAEVQEAPGCPWRTGSRSSPMTPRTTSSPTAPATFGRSRAPDHGRRDLAPGRRRSGVPATRGVEYHYAPPAFVPSGNGNVTDMRKILTRWWNEP